MTTTLNSTRLTGVIKWFDAGKGYGFIIPSEGAEIFVHVKQLSRHIRPVAPGLPLVGQGDVVDFHSGADRNGRPCAMSVRLVERAQPQRPHHD